ncbi:MAG: L-threonylcarbamoyladenylate synthase [Nitrospirota bacterium]
MLVIKVSQSGIVKAISEAVEVVGQGGIVAFPTETFYGLGVKYDNISVLERLYEIKHRPKEKAMPLIIGDRKMLGLVAASVSAIAEKLMDRFWPGPLTVLLNAIEGLSGFITAETGKVAVRIPGSSFALEFVKSLAYPVTATSANISGMPPADNAADLVRYFYDRIDMLIDGGKTRGGKPSTIVDATGEGIRILRPGAVPDEEIREFIRSIKR